MSTSSPSAPSTSHTTGFDPVAATRVLAVGSLAGLIALGLAWELWLAPLRPGGSLMALKVLPLVVPLAGLLKRRMYTYRWVSLLIWIYFTEGVVRAWSDTQLAGRVCAGIEIVLCLMLFVACAWHVRTRLARADALKAEAPEQPATNPTP
ncbi:DUF2069 domain-containing protein [Variovorax dokdonensis]|uniref:DUF2069 domain-containing protein n=1 Tax=Variovorax dokdonensis TaxID=344883 RepID=A0ABT7NC76_9BURK|nr:DUF2069 domain-containing protein [Variovorax dokdonensis]MDM0045544.1 DUF2069 domain-containing protein [Variovorax dokdonensis]